MGLWGCTINGEAGVAIVAVDDAAPGQIAVMPLFVAITPSMAIEFDGERESGGGGGPKRQQDVQAAVRETTSPRPR